MFKLLMFPFTSSAADRIIGTGPYCILSQSSSKDPSNPRRNTYLLYTLTAPLEMGPVQKAFNLSKEGSFGVNVKNPKGGDRQGTGLPNKAEFSEERELIDHDKGFALDPEGIE